MDVSKYSKAIAALGSAIAVAVAACADGTVTSAEQVAIAAAVVGVFAVFGVRNK